MTKFFLNKKSDVENVRSFDNVVQCVQSKWCIFTVRFEPFLKVQENTTAQLEQLVAADSNKASACFSKFDPAPVLSDTAI